jgi:hypothetical protein
MFFKLPKQQNIQQGEMQESDRAAMKSESKRLFVIVTALVLLFFAAIAAIFLSRPDYDDFGKGIYGNTPGNLANMGYLAANDGWIYVSDGDGLYKARPDGSEKTKLVDGLDASDINVADGWIYFRGDMGLYKMRTDGTGLLKMTDSSARICMEDGWLYYNNIDKNGFYLCKMRTDGTEKTQLTKGASEITVADGWVYYTDGYDDSSLYKIKADGTDKTKLNGRGSFDITVSGDYVYFVTSNESSSWGDLYRIRTDGTGETKLSEIGVSFNVSNGWIYYCYMNYINDKWELSLHKMRTDGTDDVKLCDGVSAYLYIAGDWIYYYDGDWYSMMTDGTRKQRVD